MKIKNNNISQLTGKKLIKTNLNFKIKQITNLFSDRVTLLEIKTVLKIIFNFHYKNKKILFLGGKYVSYDRKIKHLLVKTGHTLIPESIWMSGVITNKKNSFKFLINNEAEKSNFYSKTLLHLKKQHDLVVILGSTTDHLALPEVLSIEKPIIGFINNMPDNVNKNITYRINGHLEFAKIKNKNFFLYSVLKSMLKKIPKKTQPKYGFKN